MARHNIVNLYGQLMRDPEIMKDKEGNYIRGRCVVNIIRGVRDTGDKIEEIKYSHPVILTKNIDMIKEMETWKGLDMVEVKGCITTSEVKKSTKCKECGTKNSINGNIAYVSPIYLSRRETGLSLEDGLTLLKKRCEISNQVLLIGSLCREPETYTPQGTSTSKKSLCVTQYQLAINRSYHIKEDPQEIKTDYPWVKSYGKIAEFDAKALHTGSLVLVDGMIQTRKVPRMTTCTNPDCGCQYNWEDSALEIVPYKTEYLQNFNPFETEEKQDIDGDIFGTT